MAKKKQETGSLSIHTENIFPIIKKWLYSEHDIFLRELVSNAIDALRKRQTLAADVSDLKVKVEIDEKEKSLRIWDNGIGMTADEIRRYINQIAFSGAEEFVEQFKDAQGNIIGHFGLGFYSAFMVASKVTIDSLSYQEGAEPAFWECDGSTEFTMSKGSREEIGTTITVYLNDESQDYIQESKIQGILEKFCQFMPFPIEFKDKAVNQTEALWNKAPKDVTEEEYKNFYRTLFHDWADPLFWIHLNVDYPFNLKGILYFPKIKNEMDLNRGEVKLFCNNVFVADNLKDLIPEFLLLLKGGIDIPDIPLNVSRSFLQNDKQLQKISRYIIKKVADHFAETWKEDRTKFETYWDDISNFIKFGLISDTDFYEAMKDMIIFKAASGGYVTIEEYKNRSTSEDKVRKIYYAPSEDTQVSYLNLLKEQGIEVVFANSVLDNHLIQLLESKMTDIRFVRVDSEMNEDLVDKEKTELVDLNNRTDADKIQELFMKSLNSDLKAEYTKDSYEELIKKYPQVAAPLAAFVQHQEDFSVVYPYELPPAVREEIGKEAFTELTKHMYPEVEVEVKSLKSSTIPAMIVFDEFMRRFQEMNAMMRQEAGDMLKHHKLIVNAENPTIKSLLAKVGEGKAEQAGMLCQFIHEIALLEQKRFDGKELRSFIDKANQILTMVE